MLGKTVIISLSDDVLYVITNLKVQFVYPCLQLCVSLIKLNIAQKLSDVNN